MTGGLNGGMPLRSLLLRVGSGVEGDPQAAALRMFGPLDGARIAGGCDECDGCYQSIESVEAGIWRLVIFHDPGCRFMRRRAR